LSQPISVAIESGIAVITIDNPPVNAISRRSAVDCCRSPDLAGMPDVKAVVLHCAGRTLHGRRRHQ
jgi:3-hydroxyacyl-CoA dehydrogenase